MGHRPLIHIYIHIQIHRLGKMVVNHFNQPNRVTDRALESEITAHIRGVDQSLGCSKLY